MEIKAYFGDIKSANETVKKLKSAGFNNSYVDANDHYVDNRNIVTNLPGTADGKSLADLVINSGDDNMDHDTAPLAAASPMVSGMSDFEEITDINYTLFVNTEDNDSNEAKDIIENMGGTLENPNVSITETIAKSDIIIDESANQIGDMK